MLLTESVRARLYKVTGSCPTCHGPGMSVPAIAKVSGCTPWTVQRFMAGKSVTSGNLDILAAWITTREDEP